jgi:hypothetical protein
MNTNYRNYIYISLWGFLWVNIAKDKNIKFDCHIMMSVLLQQKNDNWLENAIV